MPDDVRQERAAEEGPSTRGGAKVRGVREGWRGGSSWSRLRGNHAPREDCRTPRKEKAPEEEEKKRLLTEERAAEVRR